MPQHVSHPAGGQLLDYCDQSTIFRRPDHDLLLRRAVHLPPKDEALIRAITQGATQHDTAKLLGHNPGTISRRIKRLTRLLHDPLVAALIDAPDGLRPETQQLGIDRYLLRRSLAQLVRLHGLKPTEILRELAFVKGWHKGRSQHSKSSPPSKSTPARPTIRH